MGICAAAELADRRSMIIDQQLKQDSAPTNNLLLIGPGESGKSTFMKQLVQLFGTGHNPEDFRPIIYRNIMNNIAHLILKSEEWSHDDQADKYMISPDLGLSAENLKAFNEKMKGLDLDDTTKEVFTPNVAKLVKAIWTDKGIQNVFSQRSRLQILDSSPHFFDKVEEIAADDYVPSTKDIILSRVRTLGYTETKFTIKGQEIIATDVGGQRSERKKWLHFFDKCTSLIYFVALSEYDMTLFEEESKNRMREALELFHEISNSRWFTSCPLILFFNKVDLFEDKVQRVPIKDWFPEFEGEQNFETGKKFFRDIFLNSVGRADDVYVHFTCAIDGNSIGDLVDSLTSIIIRNNADESDDELE